MRAALAITFLLAIVFMTPALAPGAGHTLITGEELQSMMKHGRAGLKIVDVREKELYVAGHIQGAVNIPYKIAKERIQFLLKKSDGKIIFVCHGGPMGDKLAAILIGKGFKEVYNLKGGMKLWNGPTTGKK